MKYASLAPQLADFCLQAFIFEGLKVSARGEKAGAGDLRKQAVVARRTLRIGTPLSSPQLHWRTPDSRCSNGSDALSPTHSIGDSLAVLARVLVTHAKSRRQACESLDRCGPSNMTLARESRDSL